MSNPAFSFNQGRGLAAARSAEAMLRALGGGEVLLRFAARAVDEDGDPRLGLATTTSQDVVISPAVVRTEAFSGARRIEMLFAASSLEKQVELRSCDGIEALLNSTIAIVHNGRAYRVAGVATEFYGGIPYLYRVTVTE